MSIRYYPDPEGYRDSEGNPYPLQPAGTIRKELDEWAKAFIQKCHELGWYFEPTSINSGRHTPESMYYRGLAVDFNCKESNGNWISFKDQADQAAKVAEELGLNAWLWVSDLDTHTHISIHP